MSDDAHNLIEKALHGGHLTQHESVCVFESIMSGGASANEIESLLLALADRGETVDEIVGAATVMRRHATHVHSESPNTIDTCGTGGDGVSTFNVSTAAAIVAAAAGAKVAKHGNRSYTRKSGSTEVMAELGVNVDAPPAVVTRCIHEAGIGFLNAALLHPAMAHVADIRRKIGKRTLFNMLGPLTNPAGVHRQVVGVPRLDWLEKLAAAMQKLGAVHALVVCGNGSLCDFTITGPSRYIEVKGDRMTPHIVVASDVGLKSAQLASLLVDGPSGSANAIRAVLGGEHGPRRDHTLFNAAAALVVAGIAHDISAGVRIAGHAIDDHAAQRTLERLVHSSQEPA